MDFVSLLQIIVTLFLLLCTGFLCRKIGIVDDLSSKKFSRLIIEIGQPALIISALIGADYSRENVRLGMTVLVLGFILHAIFAVFAFFASKAILSPDEQKLTEFSVIFSNCGFIGFPILKSLFGDTGLFMGAYYVVSFNLLIWTWGIVVLARGRKDIHLTVRRALLNFGTVPCAVGIGLYLSRIPLPDFVYTFSGYLADLCTPISVMITGALIATRPLKELFLSARLYYQSFLKLVALPLLTATLVKVGTVVFSIQNAELWILFSVTVSALPSAATVTMLAERYNLEGAGYSSQAVGLSSLLSLVTLPCIMWVAKWVAML